MRSIELFAGGGGLALGTHLAGFTTEVVAEWNAWCCSTLRNNRDAHHPLVRDIEVREGDVRHMDWSEYEGAIDLVSGGPPCQPFSVGGLAKGNQDHRDMFGATAEIIRQIRPKAFLVENVRGLTRPRFAEYFEYIQLRLSFPDVIQKDGEQWFDHLARLQALKPVIDNGLHYNLSATLVNAANYGVPQQRWRVFIVGFRDDQEVTWSFPAPTHSADALKASKASGAYWERHQIPKHLRPKVSGVQGVFEFPELKPWRTVRDALCDIPEPKLQGSSKYLNHVLQPGARAYPGHDGSAMDAPSKALKAGVHGVPGGENMLRHLDGSVRYYTVREAARIQTFPDRYDLNGPWTEAMRQLGNAVPVRLAETVASAVHQQLFLAEARSLQIQETASPVLSDEVAA